MRCSTLGKDGVLTFEGDAGRERDLGLAFAVFSVAALAVLIASEADELVLSGDRAVHNDSCMLEAAAKRYDLLLLAIKPFYSLR